ncbi:MAG: AI-2E family transporter [Clostridia bacterium]|nr:AI-2E family transporter [Clostridia bacterium]
MTRQGKKLLLSISLAVIGIVLVIHYWATIASWIGDIYKALLPCLIGAVIAYLINILMRFYERHYFAKKNPPFAQKSRTAVCLVLAILTILCVIAGIIVLIVPQLIDCVKLIVQQAPKGVEALLKNDKIVQYLPESVYDWLANWREKLTDQAFWSEIVTKATAILKTGIGTAGGKITSALSSTASTLGAVVIGIVFSIYYLACRGQIQRNVQRLANSYLRPTVKEKVFHYAAVFNSCFHKYIVAQCLEALILGSLCLCGMLILRLPYAPMISALVCLMALIPIVGATISAVVGTVMILAVSPWQALIFFAMLMVVQVIEGNLIFPKVVGKSVGAPGLIVFAAVTVGGSLFGILGMMVSVPAATAVFNELRADMKQREAAAVAAAAPPEE